MKNGSIHAIISTCILTAGLVWTGCNSSPKATEASKQANAPTPAIETTTLEKGDLATVLKIPAELFAYREVDLYAKLNSYVKNLTVDVGSSVKKGQLLATLEAPELVSQLSASESKLKAQEAIFTASNATYQRILETSKTPGTISKNDVDIALAKKNADLAQFEAARADYKANSIINQYLKIYAPFDGVISARNVNLGAYIGPSGKGSEAPIFTLQQLHQLRLVISVPEAYKNFIRLNDRVEFTVKSFPSRTFSAKIARRAGVMDKQLRSEHIELDVENDGLMLSPGMVAEATIKLSSGANAFVVPKKAVINSQEGIFLIQSLDGKAKKIPARMGRVTDSLAEVFGENLKEGMTIVTKASEEIRDGKLLQ